MKHLSDEWFRDWFNSPYYHILYQNRDIFQAKSELELLLNKLKPKKGSLALDLACGKGRHSFVLADNHLEVVGLDLSEESIESAKEALFNGVLFDVHDMRNPIPYGPFDYVFNLFTSFGYFELLEENIQTLVNVKNSMKPGSLFVLDYLNGDRVIENLIKSEYKKISEVEFEINRFVNDHKIIKDIKITDDGKITHFQERVSYFSIGDFKNMFEKAGLKILEFWGDYSGASYNSLESHRLIILAERQNEPG